MVVLFLVFIFGKSEYTSEGKGMKQKWKFI